MHSSLFSRRSRNEPNLKNPLPHIVGEFWTGTQLEYYRLYEATSKALKNVSTTLKVGGPTTSGTPAWIPSFLQYCQKHSIPLDFISSHSYPSDTRVDEFIDSIEQSVNISKHVNKPFFLSEYNDGLGFGCCHDRSYAASFLVHMAYKVQAPPSRKEGIVCFPLVYFLAADWENYKD